MRLTIRAAELSECEAYVRATWGRLRGAGVSASRERIDRILRLAPSIIIATPHDERSEILGYAIGDDSCLDYLYVRNVYRRLGIASKLYEQLGKPPYCSQRMRTGKTFAAFVAFAAKHHIQDLETHHATEESKAQRAVREPCKRPVDHGAKGVFSTKVRPEHRGRVSARAPR